MKTGADRRVAAPHPGPMLKRRYLDALGVDIPAFAAHVGMDASCLAAMLEGRESLDVAAAVRIARALQLPAERIMQMQVRYDFSAARGVAALEGVDVLRPSDARSFPDGFLSGHLGRSSDGVGGVDSFYFRENVARRIAGDDYAGLHALWRGDRLRVYDPAGVAIWSGPILEDFEGRMLLPYVRAGTWQPWFAAAYRADLAICAAHEAYLAGARGA